MCDLARPRFANARSRLPGSRKCDFVRGAVASSHLRLGAPGPACRYFGGRSADGGTSATPIAR